MNKSSLRYIAPLSNGELIIQQSIFVNEYVENTCTTYNPKPLPHSSFSNELSLGSPFLVLSFFVEWYTIFVVGCMVMCIVWRRSWFSLVVTETFLEQAMPMSNPGCNDKQRMTEYPWNLHLINCTEIHVPFLCGVFSLALSNSVEFWRPTDYVPISCTGK